MQHKCGSCPDFFLTTDQLRLHEKEMHSDKVDNRNSKNGPCPFCGKTFTFNNLNRHIEKMHSSLPATFICTMEGCTKAYKTKNDLEVHLLRHKMLQCELCGYTG